MLNVTNQATRLLKAAKDAAGASAGAGIRIVRGSDLDGDGYIPVGFALSNAPAPGDNAIEQDGLKIFVEEDLIDTLDGRTLDVDLAGEGPELVFR